MKQLLLFLAATSILLFCTPVYVSAISPTPTLGLPVPGTCGNALSQDPSIRKCCKMPVLSPELYVEAATKGIPIVGGALSQFITDKMKDQLQAILFTQKQISVQPCDSGTPSTPGDVNNDACICIMEPTPAALSTFKPVCARIKSTSEQTDCNSCSDGGGVWTALGCFSGNISEFIAQKILGTGVGIAGGISMLCIMFAAFQMQTSRGNAEKIKKAQELMTNCITGLMVIIFSVLILKIIGVDILRIPGLTAN